MHPLYIPEGHYYSKAQVAELRGVLRQTVQQWIEKGWLPALYIGGAYLINAKDLEGFETPRPGPQKKTTTSQPVEVRQEE